MFGKLHELNLPLQGKPNKKNLYAFGNTEIESFPRLSEFLSFNYTETFQNKIFIDLAQYPMIFPLNPYPLKTFFGTIINTTCNIKSKS